LLRILRVLARRLPLLDQGVRPAEVIAIEMGGDVLAGASFAARLVVAVAPSVAVAGMRAAAIIAVVVAIAVVGGAR